MIGILGNLQFTTGSQKMKTFKDIEISTATRYGSHNTLQGKPKLEFTGDDLDTVKLKLYWRIEDGVNPAKEIKPLEEQRKKGEVISFILGGEKVGNGFYVIESINKSPKRIDNKGNILAEGFDISLKEYRVDPKKPQKTTAESKTTKAIAQGKQTVAKVLPSVVTAVTTKSPSMILNAGLTIGRLLKKG